LCGHVSLTERDWDDEHEEYAVTDRGGAFAPAAASPEAPGGLSGDGEILEALGRGDRQAALRFCVQLHGVSIGRLCMAMVGSQVDADDLTQETFITAHQGFAEFRQQGSVRAWLLGIARNKCLHHLEKHRRRGARLRLVTAGEAALEEGTPDLVGVRSRAEQARALLLQVRPSDRDALLLRYAGELSFKEVAAACGIAEAAARKRVSRALLALRSALGKEADDE
jgi:RNA polymerase sigma-70 factor, ECF subfamily